MALTAACETLLKDVSGFQWLSHHANYTNFPASLLITCVFDTRESVLKSDSAPIHKAIQRKLLKIGVKIKAPKQQIVFDSEDACSEEHGGDWNLRFEGQKNRSVTRNRPD
jgi:hypothetical protein